MTTVAVQLTDEQAERLKQIADNLNLTMEQLARARVLEICQESDERFQEALQYVLEKNAELYRRLA